MRTGERVDPGLVRVVSRAARYVTAHVEPLLKAEGLTVDQWLVLDALAESPNSTMSELAGATLITGPTLTRAADRLVSSAVAFREVDAHDRRKVRVHLSARGRVAHRRIAGAIAELEERLLTQAAGSAHPEPRDEAGHDARSDACTELLAALRRLGG